MARNTTTDVINWSTAIERLKAGAGALRTYVADTDLVNTLNGLNKAHVPAAAQDEVAWIIETLDGMSRAITNDSEDVPAIPVPAARDTTV